ncbi:GTP-binding protein [Candidatus Gracilibacteria bacterium]|nr:GTP-binding protein [Candidatus Gracilibacteria bacterium]
MATFKIIVTGISTAATSLFIRTASISATKHGTPRLSVSDAATLHRLSAAGLEVGYLPIDTDYALLLVGIAASGLTEEVWEHLSIGKLGYVVLVDSCKPATLTATQGLIRRFASLFQTPFVVAANKQDHLGALPPSYIRTRLGLPCNVPVLPCIDYELRSVHTVLAALCTAIEARSTALLVGGSADDGERNNCTHSRRSARLVRRWRF